MFFKKRRLSRRALGLGYGYKKQVSTRKKLGNIGNIKPGKLGNLRKLLILILLIGTVASGIYWMRFSPNFKIQKIEVKYKESQEEGERLKYYFQNLIGKNLIFTDLDGITEKIKKENPDLEKLEVKKIFPHSIQISFSKYPITANIKIDNKKFLINEIGYIIYEETENPNLPYIQIFTEKEINKKEPIIRQEDLKYILESTQFFEEKFGMKITETQYLLRAREIHLKTEKYFSVWLDITKPYANQILKLKKAVPRLDIYNLPLEYIDLRISGANGEKIIYRRIGK